MVFPSKGLSNMSKKSVIASRTMQAIMENSANWVNHAFLECVEGDLLWEMSWKNRFSIDRDRRVSLDLVYILIVTYCCITSITIIWFIGYVREIYQYACNLGCRKLYEIFEISRIPEIKRSEIKTLLTREEFLSIKYMKQRRWRLNFASIME